MVKNNGLSFEGRKKLGPICEKGSRKKERETILGRLWKMLQQLFKRQGISVEMEGEPRQKRS